MTVLRAINGVSVENVCVERMYLLLLDLAASAASNGKEAGVLKDAFVT